MSQSTLFYEQGKKCYQEKKFDEAIEQFSEAIKSKPDSDSALARCYNARGVVYFYLGDFKKVIKDCTKALELDKSNANYFNCRGNAHFSLGKFDKAAEDFTKAIELSPEASHGRYFNNRGSAYRRLKNFKEAIDDYTKAIHVDPKNGNYYNNRGNTYFDMGEFQAAIDDFTTALGLEPYSPKTKLTLAQAHEALAQERRMKNTSKYDGRYISLKPEGKETKRKERTDCHFHISPFGVEVLYTHGGLIKKKECHAFEWSEDMKIELLDENRVKLYLDERRHNVIIIEAPDATAVEEELIGRITTKFASYSTSCLVAQHESVVNEYTDILATIKNIKDQCTLMEELVRDADKQRVEFEADGDQGRASASRNQVIKLQKQIADNQAQLEVSKTRAESVRMKAEQEAGPVLDMVLIMQNRVKELDQSRAAAGKDEDLLLSNQLKKMERLVQKAQSLADLVARPVDEVERAFNRVEEDEEEEERVEKFQASQKEKRQSEVPPPPPAAEKPVAAPAPKPAPKPVAVPTPAAEEESDEEEISDWDDHLDEVLPGNFAPKDSEVFLTIEHGPSGMVTYRPVKQAPVQAAPAEDPDAVRLRKEELEAMTQQQRAAQERLSQMEAEREELLKHQRELEAASGGVGALLSEKDSALQDTLSALEQKERDLAATHQKLSAKDQALASLLQTNESLANIRAVTEQAKAELEQKLAALEAKNAEALASNDMSRSEKEAMAEAVKQRSEEVRTLNSQLDSYNKALAAKQEEADRQSHELQAMAGKSAELESLINKMRQNADADKASQAQQQQEFTSKMSAIQSQALDLQRALEATQAEKKQMQEQVEMQSMTLAQLRRHLAQVQSDLQAANEAKAAQEKALQNEEQRRKDDAALIEKMKDQARKEELKRRQLHNLIQEIKGNIRVYVRQRPDFLQKNTYPLFEEVVGSDGRGVRVYGPKEKSTTGKSGMVQKTYDFEFDRVFTPKDSQQTVFEEISGLVTSALDGYRVSIFAYGQTGSGKTFTMEGPEEITEASRGVIPRAVQQIFEYRDSIADRGWVYDMDVSYLEIYNNDIRDLLSGEPPGQNSHDIKMVMEGKETRTVVDGLKRMPVSSPAELRPILSMAASNRTTAATSSNARSSRSHSVFTMTIVGSHKESGQSSIGVLNLVDLAGSERVDKSQVTGDRLEETKAINSSLTCLGDVIAAIAQGAKFVPFRNSKLTYLLQDSFGGGSKTLMFINVSGEEEHLQETLCSLRFGAKVHECHIGSAKKADAKK